MKYLLRHGLRRVVAIALGLAVARCAVAEVKRYVIEPGGEYSYFPGPEGTGIPGCNPSSFQCDFDIEGSFAVDFDREANTATLFDLDLSLLGNEDIQNDPPSTLPVVTADRVANFLVGRLFEQTSTTGTSTQYLDPTDQDFLPDFLLTEFVVDDTVSLTGGIDRTGVDFIGVDFNFTAAFIPEPSGMVLAGSGLASVLLLMRRRARHMR